MTHKHILIVPALLAAAALACNLPIGGDNQTAAPPATASGTTAGEATASPRPDLPDAATDPSPQASAPTSTPFAPSGWVLETATTLGISYYRPPDWEVSGSDAGRVELREPDAFAWIELNRLDESTDDAWSITYRPGLSADEIMKTLIAAARQDGTYDEPHHVVTPDGRTAWATQGYNDLLEANVFIGVIGYADRALIVLGHDSGVEGEWDSTLLPLYQSFFAAILPTA